MARPYTGLAEMEESLVPPPPKLVVVTPPNPTSPAASETYVSTAGRVASSVASDTAAPSSFVASSAAAAAATAKPSAHASCSPVAAPAAASVASSDTAIRPVRHSKAPALLLESSEDEASDDEETSVPGSSVQYYTAKSPKSKRHRWLVLFFDYLSRPSAGDKKTSIRIQHVSQMRRILEAIDPEGDDITCLVQNEGDIVWSEWVKPHMEAGTKKPGTLISYLTSYEKFLSLVTHQRFNKSAPPLHPDYYDTLANVLKDLKGCRSVVDSKSYAVKNKRVVDETEGLLTLDELDSIKASSAYNQAVRLVLQAGNGRELSHKEFIYVRDFLITRFSLDTGTRPGPLNNATLEEFEKGTVKDDCKVMLVARHKRAKDGPAICPMLPELHRFMNIYVMKIRPLFASSDEKALFVTSEGVGFPESTIGKRLTAFIEKCGVSLGGRMAFVDMRKVISTEMLSRCSPEEREILRRVLAHSEKTSREWYSRPNLTETGIKAVHIVQRLLDPQARAQHQDAATANPVTPSATKPASMASSGIKPPTETSGLTAMQKEELMAIFQKNIADGQPVKLQEVREKIRGVTILSVLTGDESKVKQVANFINFLARKKSAEETSPPLSEVGARSKVSSWLHKLEDPSNRSSKSVRRTEWDDKEAKHLLKVFAKFTALPTTHIIRTIIDGDAKLREILERDGWPRIYNKLKNVFRGKK